METNINKIAKALTKGLTDMKIDKISTLIPPIEEIAFKGRSTLIADN